jgi:O-antigen/teichoic acid export membrane protein
MRVGFFPILLIAFFAPWLLHIFLGAKWQEVGIFSQIIAPWVAINFVFSPLSSVFSVLERQRAGLIFEIVHLPLRIISLFFGAKTGNVLIAVMFLTIVNAGIYFLKLVYLYLVTENSIASFLRDFVREVSFAILLCIFPVLSLQMSLGTVVIILVVLLSVVYYSKQLLSMLGQT